MSEDLGKDEAEESEILAHLDENDKKGKLKCDYKDSNGKCPTVKMENRAWKGVRLETETTIKEPNREYHYSIGWHVPIGMFYLEEQITYLDRPHKETYGRMINFSKRIKPLIERIEEMRKVKVEVKDPEALKAQEDYSITDGKRLLEKHPSWKTQVSPDKIIS